MSSPALAPSLSLYHLPVQSASSLPLHVCGSFTRPAAQELCVLHGSSTLAIYRPDDATGRLELVSTINVLGEVLTLTSFRLLGGGLDYVAVTGDSGYLSILAFDDKQRQLVRVHNELLGKTGMRRGTASQYVCVEAKGRAIMCAALERAKLTFIINRQQPTSGSGSSGSSTSGTAAAAASLTISSPLEAHRSNQLTLSLASVDVGYDNPLFVALEIEYGADDERSSGDATQKQLAYYELDLGLNHVTRKHSELVDPAAHSLLTVPGPADGPGGLLILCESYVIYHPFDPLFSLPAASANSPFPYLSSRSLRTYFPRRHGLDVNLGLLTICHASHIQRGLIFFLLQSEHGDLYKLTMAGGDEGRPVTNVYVSYFDSIPPATSLSVLRSGYLFAGSESGWHGLYQLVGLGNADDDPDWVCSDCGATEDALQGSVLFFHARGAPRNLSEADRLDGLHPIMDMRVSDPLQVTAANIVRNRSDHMPVVYALCGKSNRSTLRFLRHGLPLNEIALSDLPALPTAVFTLRTDHTVSYHQYIVVSFSALTIVLSVGDTVSDVSDTGLLDNVQSLYVSALSDGSLLQVHSGGLRHVRADKRVNEWKPPGKKQISLAAGNERAVVICLSGGEMVYFEMDRHGLMTDMYRKDMMNDVAAIAIAPVEPGKLRGRWVMVGGYDATVRIFSTDPTAPLQQMSVLAVNGQVAALLAVMMNSEDQHDDSSASHNDHQPGSAGSSLYVYTGLSSGVYIRSQLDQSTGVLCDHRKRFLGPHPVRLQRLQVRGSSAVLALCDRSWIDYSLPASSSTSAVSHHVLLPLSYDPMLDSAAFFSSQQCAEGVVAIVGPTLRILSLEGVERGQLLYSQSVPLRYTPRKMDIVPSSQYIAVIETDQNAYSRRERKELEQIIAQGMEGEVEAEGGANTLTTSSSNSNVVAVAEDNTPTVGAANGVKADDALSEDGRRAKAEEERKLDEMLGAPYAGEGKWASCVSLHPPPFVAPHAPCVVDLEDNEAAFSVVALQFDAAVYGNDYFLAVGTARDLTFAPRKMTCGYIHIYQITSTHQLRFIHKTQVTEVPLALAAFNRRLLAGVGRSLRVYELGKRKLLKKSETKLLSSTICHIQHVPNTERIVVGQLTDGFAYLHLSPATNTFAPFSDSSLPRFLTAAQLLDLDTVAGADKFGNVFVCRLPPHMQLLSDDSSASSGATVDVELATLAARYGQQGGAGSATFSGRQHAIAAANKLHDVVSFHTDSVVTAMVKVNFHPHGASVPAMQPANHSAQAAAAALSTSVLLCATLSGALLCFVPLSSVEDIELLTHLELHMRAALPSLVGRDHLAYRSAFLPVKGVIDGALVERFSSLPREKQDKMAEELVSSATDIRRKLEDIRRRML